jgi:hypothetical protein
VLASLNIHVAADVVERPAQYLVPRTAEHRRDSDSRER